MLFLLFVETVKVSFWDDNYHLRTAKSNQDLGEVSWKYLGGGGEVLEFNRHFMQIEPILNMKKFGHFSVKLVFQPNLYDLVPILPLHNFYIQV